MKNSTLYSLLIGCAISPLAVMAQPTLTASGINPVVGDIVTTHNAQYVSPGSAGANQTWNLGFTSSGSGSSTGVTPSSTPYGASFPNATVAFGPTVWAYYKPTPTVWELQGVVNSAGTVIAYSDVEDFLRFPTTYNSTYTDAWDATYTQATYTYYRWGTTTVTADGWGTLTTPEGTFTNVMRVHFVQNYQDSTNIMSTPFVITYNNDQYMWYLNGNHYPIASVATFTTSAGSPITFGYYLDNVLSGVEEEQSLNSLSLYPNPANNVINFNYALTQQENVTISIYNAAGQLVGEPSQVPGYEGENTYVLSVSDLPEGAYYSTMTMDGNIPVTRKFIVTH